MGSKSEYYKELGIEGGEEVMTPDVVEEILSKVRLRGRSDSRHQWPDEWDAKRGFRWEYIPVEQGFEENEEEIEMEIPEIPEDLRIMSVSPPPTSSRLQNLQEEGEVEEQEDEEELLEAEESYLNEFDDYISKIEHKKLKNYINHGGPLPQKQTYKDVMSSFVDTTKEVWDTVRKRFISWYGFEWTSYDNDEEWVVGRDGMGYEGGQEWELFQKENPRKRKFEEEVKQENITDSEQMDITESDHNSDL